MPKERFACQKCPAFYDCSKPHMKATAGGWKSERIDGKNVLLCIPDQNKHGGQEMRQYAYYCLATPKGRMIAGKGYGVDTWEFWMLTISMVIACFASISAWGNW